MEGIMGYTEQTVLSNGNKFINYIQHIKHIHEGPEYANTEFVICCDNSTVHKNRVVEQYCREHSISILFITAYSPWLNPVEGYIGRIKSRLSSNKKDGK